MKATHAQLRLAPITSGPIRSNPKVLLGGAHQPSLLRYLDGWPRRNSRSRALLVQFAAADESLARFADDSFDLAVIQSPSAECLDECIRELTRVARQGLITRR
ncbi:methionine biosynthesis protein MetW [Stutzerimonas stutzeri]|uniref:methionine biosynthesis protein MetW n=1 Tax=Stutzerimonas sp. S1 TaxID=3030652 RepID=UPI002223F4BE|nr:methionine biosynthesis protein MetW [Stutzerimonas sp. S1]MCW3148819.1 methionine biosynthesis protein MetW [Stutzerimonas sp. S1]